MGLFDFFNKDKTNKKLNRKEKKTVNTEFVNSITFEEDPFEDEVPAYTQMYDLEGNEVEQ